MKVTREELQSTIEQLESSNDQLKASNEEVTASNEELQSGNEELETSKEELQSLNEELNTINARLQEKVGELENTNNDVLNLLSSTAIATVFLDKELRVKRFTPASTRLLSLIPSDLGRPVADVLRRFADETLLDDARRVLAELTPLAKEVQAEDGRWYFRRITPYRTQDDRIEGVVLTFVDVSDIKQAEQALRASEKKYRDLVESANSFIIRWKPDGELIYFNRYGLSFFGYREEEILGHNVMTLIPDQDSSGHDLTGLATAIVEHPEQYINNENENVLADGRRVWVQWANKAILDEEGNVREILAIGNDITERKRAEEELRLAHVRASWLARFPEENPNPVLRVSAEGEVLYCNPAAVESGRVEMRDRPAHAGSGPAACQAGHGGRPGSHAGRGPGGKDVFGCRYVVPRRGIRQCLRARHHRAQAGRGGAANDYAAILQCPFRHVCRRLARDGRRPG